MWNYNKFFWENQSIVFKTRETYFLNRICLPSKNSKLSLFHLGREEETLDDENDDVSITVCHCLFLINTASNQKLMTTNQKPLYHFPRKVAKRSLILVSTVLMSPFCGNGFLRGITTILFSKSVSLSDSQSLISKWNEELRG